MRLTVPVTILAVATIASIAIASTGIAWSGGALAGGADGPDSGSAATAPRREEIQLDAMRADYLEDEQTNRRLAVLDLNLVYREGEAFLLLRIAATGPTVDPVPSFRGVHGSNHITARDLTELLDTRRIKIVAMPRHGSGKRFGKVSAGAKGRVPERRLRPGGELDLDAESAEVYLLSIECESPPLGSGEHEVYVEVKGLPRLRVDVRVTDSSSAVGIADGKILGIECLGGHNVRVKR